MKVGSQSDREPMPLRQRRRSFAFGQTRGNSALSESMVPYRQLFWERATAGNVGRRRPKAGNVSPKAQKCILTLLC
jgi:hypothetical protein